MSPRWTAVMLGASAVLVFGVVAWLFSSMEADDALIPGFEQLIHAPVPWGILGLLWLGGILGIAAALQRRRWFVYPLVGLELLLVGFVSFYFLQISWLPDHRLNVAVGDAFPAYQLVDQDEQPQVMAASTPREPALYIFYRGDW